MPESITPLLADRLDISEDRADALLHDTLRELRTRARTDGVQLSELGTFQEEDGTLTFVPSASLRRRVNQQFEGLSPEDLSAPSEEGTEEPASPKPPPESVGDEAAEDIPAIDLLEETPSPPSASDESESTSAASPSAEPEAETSEHDEPAPAETGFSARGLSIVGGIALGLLLAVGGWFFFTQTSLFSSGTGGTDYETAETETPPPSTTNKSADTVAAEGPTSGNQKSAAPASAQETWTLVAASRTSQDAAEQTANQYEGAFSTVQVVPGTVDGHTWYRVTLGRYPSKAAAQRALKAHAPQLPPDAWIHRLQ